MKQALVSIVIESFFFFNKKCKPFYLKLYDRVQGHSGMCVTESQPQQPGEVFHYRATPQFINSF